MSFKNGGFMVNTLVHYYRDNVISHYRYRDSILIRDNRFIVIIAQHYHLYVWNFYLQ